MTIAPLLQRQILSVLTPLVTGSFLLSFLFLLLSHIVMDDMGDVWQFSYAKDNSHSGEGCSDTEGSVWHRKWISSTLG